MSIHQTLIDATFPRQNKYEHKKSEWTWEQNNVNTKIDKELLQINSRHWSQPFPIIKWREMSFSDDKWTSFQLYYVAIKVHFDKKTIMPAMYLTYLVEL